MNPISTIEARHANWLPLPGERSKSGVKAPVVDENDLFPKGDIQSFYPRQGTGFVRTASGEMLAFSLAELELIGPKNKPDYIATGGRVGFDYSHTSHGLRVTKLKVY